MVRLLKLLSSCRNLCLIAGARQACRQQPISSAQCRGWPTEPCSCLILSPHWMPIMNNIPSWEKRGGGEKCHFIAIHKSLIRGLASPSDFAAWKKP